MEKFKKKEGEIMNETEKDKKFLVHVIREICDYANSNDIEPNDVLKTISENILALLQISNFNNWGEGKKIKNEE